MIFQAFFNKDFIMPSFQQWKYVVLEDNVLDNVFFKSEKKLFEIIKFAQNSVALAVLVIFMHFRKSLVNSVLFLLKSYRFALVSFLLQLVLTLQTFIYFW